MLISYLHIFFFKFSLSFILAKSLLVDFHLHLFAETVLTTEWVLEIMLFLHILFHIFLTVFASFLGDFIHSFGEYREVSIDVVIFLF